MSTALAKTDDGAALAIVEDIDLGVPVEQLIKRVEKIGQVMSRVMKLGKHYGKVPGVDKPTLLKPGAELLALTFQLAPKFKVEERWDGEHLECVVTSELTHIPTRLFVGEGLGSCSTKESKYAYRKGERKCPKCGQAAIIKGKEEYGGGWLCWKKPERGKNGCGAKFADGDKAIADQKADRVANPDLPDQYNTVRKMACKRALVAAILLSCGASELFTQDVEDLPRDGSNAGDDDGGGWDGPPDPGGGGWDDERQPQQQQRQQQRPPQNQQRNAGAGNQPRSSGGGNGADPTKSAEAKAKMLKAFDDAKTIEALEDLTPELNLLKDKRELTLDDYTALRSAYSARARELKTPARQSA